VVQPFEIVGERTRLLNAQTGDDSFRKNQHLFRLPVDACKHLLPFVKVGEVEFHPFQEAVRLLIR